MSPSPEPRPTSRGALEDLPGLLVEPSWLRERLGNPGLRLVDLRDADAYASSHVPGATHLELAELGSRVGPLENVLLPPERFRDLMAARGISSGDVVVAYDDQWGLAAARLVWALHRYGHNRVGVLDGGWDRWLAEEGPTTEGTEPTRQGFFEVVPRPDVYADREWITGRLDSTGVALLDTRTRGEYDQGHLPGAVWWDWFNAVPQDSWNVSRDPAALRAEWSGLGLDPADEVIVYCRTGMRAAHTYLVLRNAGFSRVRLYDGSWQEWSMKTDGTRGH